MIRGFQEIEFAKPADGARLQWGPALEAGLIAGAILLVVPRGSPWSQFTFFSPIVLGRNLAGVGNFPLPLIWIVHLVLALVYGVIVSALVSKLTNWRAILVGGLVGLVLYFVNLGLVALCFPNLIRAEGLVAFTHVVFGLLAAGAYRGLLHRRFRGE